MIVPPKIDSANHISYCALLYIAMHTVCLSGWVQCQTGSASELVILPSQISISAGYPARFVAIERFENGDLVDQSNNPQLSIRLSSDKVARFVAPGMLMANHKGESIFQAELAGRHATAKIRVIDDTLGIPTFPREVSAVFGRAGCNLGTCHGNLHGKGGFRLSLRGDDPGMDFEAVVRGQSGRRIDLFSPENSLLLRKPIGDVAHQGGVRFKQDSPEYEILRRWIEGECQWTDGQIEPRSNKVEVESLRVYPNLAVLRQACRRQQLVVVATFSDGIERDVTQWARFEPSIPAGVRIDDQGVVVVDGPMDVSISVAYLQGRAASRLTFLARDWAPQQNSLEPAQRLDQLVDAQLARMKIDTALAADESTFLRRSFLVTLGRLPRHDEARQFLKSTSPTKRQDLVDRLICQPEFAMLWALRWSDLLRNEQKVMSARGAGLWHQWLSNQFANDQPVTEIVGQMLTTIGSTYEHPPASFHRTHRDPETAAETIGQVFLGSRLQCARCHNHPFDRWRQDDYYGLAAYFSTVVRKQVDNAPRDKYDKHIISGDEIISLENKIAALWHPGRAENVGPKPLDTNFSATTAMRAMDSAANQASPLESLASWLTKNNRQFARNMANRAWYHLIGRGIVDPPDDFRDSNPPSNPELLEFLTDELIRSNYSLQHISRLILSSNTFARHAVAIESSQDALPGTPVFAGYPLRRMPAEILLDAICDVTGVSIEPDPSGDIPASMRNRVMSQPTVPVRAGFLTAFGKPGRLLACECERSSDVSLGQSLLLANGIEIRDKLSQPGNRIDQLLTEKLNVTAVIEELYLTALTRFPTSGELSSIGKYVEESPDRRSSLEDITWVLLNSKEFALIR